MIGGVFVDVLMRLGMTIALMYSGIIYLCNPMIFGGVGWGIAMVSRVPSRTALLHPTRPRTHRTRTAQVLAVLSSIFAAVAYFSATDESDMGDLDKPTGWGIVGGLSAAFVVSLVLLVGFTKPKYRSQYWSTERCKDCVMQMFTDPEATDENKMK